MSRLEELEAEIAALQDALAEKRAERALLLSPFVEGDVIVNERGFQKGRYRVVGVSAGGYGKFNIIAVRIRKDGKNGQEVVIHFPSDFRKVNP